MKLLLDTSILIDFARKPGQASPLYQLAKKYTTFYVSDITVAELYAGRHIWQSPQKMMLLEKMLSHTHHLPTNDKITYLAGKIRAHHQIALMDALIAATAIQHQLPVATLNQRDFRQIAELQVVTLP